MESLLKIGQVCRLYGISADTLRHYEKKGLLQPVKDPTNGYRYYSFAQLDVIDCILAGRAIGVPLAQIGEVIANENVQDYETMFHAQVQHLDEEIARLQMLRQVAAAKLDELAALAQHQREPMVRVTENDMSLYLIDVATLFSLESDAPDTEGMALLSTWRLFDMTTLGVVEDEAWTGISFASSAEMTVLEKGFQQLVEMGVAYVQRIPRGTQYHSFWGDDAALLAYLGEIAAPNARISVRIRYTLLHADGCHEYFVDIFDAD
ncbi:MAG: MerR family transcriptional regulator [Peptococcaceae bacterium]|nr:MerR family transcriptional regulator [Peptococcaceae bacterium]